MTKKHIELDVKEDIGEKILFLRYCKLELKRLTNEVLMKSSSPQTSKDQINYRETFDSKLNNCAPLRRSNRKLSKTVEEEKRLGIEKALKEGKEDGLEMKFFIGKGRGVVATKHYRRGDFVLEYAGDLISATEAKKREQKYASEEVGCFMFYFVYKDRKYCVDATGETGRLGRLINHSRKGNVYSRAVWVDKPRLIMFAARDIVPGEEITHDYGDRSKVSLKYHPWLAH